ncbi:hypothetical protein R3P38DRAFT_2860009 [Favolaschia claudopus]|uniref:DUF4203 domain-containing protein n=1 Tax=Favolaschia claudopus TaxID=2862362 RepID=A0AAW0DN83_9AGAR
MASNDTLTTLTTLLPSTSYLLAYSLPLLLLSILLTFAGAFLTLDRSRSFPAERYGVLPGAFEHKKRILFLLEGGVGGLAAGYAFGVHLSTFLSLMIPAKSSSAPLNSKTFVVVWLLSSLITTFLAGRWRYCALAFVGISGGTLFGLAVSVFVHPPVLARVIVTAIFGATSTLLVLLPIPTVQHWAVRFSSASTGAFGLVLSIALLAHIPEWANAWERLWLPVSSVDIWGTGREKGLSAGFCLFLAAGIACDWFLRRKFGECPDEKWDSYLAHYASSLPNAADRAGIFTPATSAWDRLFGSRPASKGPKDMLFPDEHGDNDDDVKLRPTSDSYEFQQSPGFLKKGRSVRNERFQARMGGKKRGAAVKFRPIGEDGGLTSSEDEEDDPLSPLSPTKAPRPWLRQKMSMASTNETLVDDASAKDPLDFEREMGRIKKKTKWGKDEAPEYSDFEEDVTAAKPSHPNRKDEDKEWSPGFMKRHRDRAVSSTASQRTAVNPSSNKSPPLGAVPATPSLIKALDRIAVAQKDAFPRDGMPGSMPGSPREEYKAGGWGDFWKDVQVKAGGR